MGTDGETTATRGARLRVALTESGRTLGKAALAVAVFAGVTIGYAQLEAHRLARAQLLPDRVGSDCGLWFVGSSSMSRWSTLERDMSPWVAHNRSIEGGTLVEISQRFANERDPDRPRALVFYAGENDIAYGVPAGKVIAEFGTFMERKAALLGDLPVFFISVKPSPTRWQHRAVQAQFNDAIRRMAATRADLTYVDIVPPLLRADGWLGDFYAADGIHMDERGYEVWTRAVRRALDTGLPRAVVRACEARG